MKKPGFKTLRRASVKPVSPARRGRQVVQETEIAHGNTHEEIYAQLKRAIMSAHYVPGERLIVSRLETVFGTSAMPIREALRRLVAEQALENSPNRGVQVPLMTASRLMDLRRVRCEIEGIAVEWAATTITNREIEQLEAIQDRLNRLTASGSADGYLDLNLDFHFTMYRAARSPLLIPIIERLWLQAGPCLSAMRGAANLGMGMDHHEDNLRALRNGDGKGARAGLEREINEAADVILRSLEGDLQIEQAGG